MKFLVMSFDDGTIDFKENSLSILQKCGLKPTINVISGFSDKTIENDFSFITIDDIKLFCSLGFEIANHTNSHLKHGSFDELKKCDDKLKEWCNESKFGIVMPKYSKPNRSAKKYIKKVNPLYITYDSKRIGLLKNFFEVVLLKIKTFFVRNQSTALNYLVHHCMYKKGDTNIFLRLSVKRETNPFTLFEAIKKMPDGYCLTVCFHSISDFPDDCYYPEGAWSVKNFSSFCELIKQDDSISVITQKEACLN